MQKEQKIISVTTTGYIVILISLLKKVREISVKIILKPINIDRLLFVSVPTQLKSLYKFIATININQDTKNQPQLLTLSVTFLIQPPYTVEKT